MNQPAVLYRIFKWGLIAAVMVMILYLSVLLAVPATFMLVRKWFVPAPEIANRYLMQAIGLTAAFLSTWFLVKYIFGWDTLVRILGMDPRKKFIGFAGITLVAVLYLLGMWWATESKSVSSKIPKNALVASGEILPKFLLDTKNLDTLPWVDEKGNFQLFWCAGPNGSPRLYTRGGPCATGGMRALLTRKAQEELYRAARNYQDKLDRKPDVLQAQKIARLEADKIRLERQLEKEWISSSAVREMFRKEIDALDKRLSDFDRKWHEVGSTTAATTTTKPPAEIVGSVQESIPKPKARVLALESHIFGVKPEKWSILCSTENAGIKFTITEKNGVSVIYDRYRISIWRRMYVSESPDQTKNRGGQVVLNEIIDDWAISGRLAPTPRIFSLGKYKTWLGCHHLVEMVFYGRDYNGNPQELKIETATDRT